MTEMSYYVASLLHAQPSFELVTQHLVFHVP